MMRVAIACGGTGGHLFPGLAVAEALQRLGHETLLLVSPKQIDATALASYPQFRAQPLPGAAFPGLFSRRLLSFLKQLMQAWKSCQHVFTEFKPEVVLGMGGFTCAVPLLVGNRRHLPTLIHESNAIPGRATRLIARRVSKVLLGFDDCAQHLSGATCVFTGTPVRQGLIRHDRAQAAERYSFNPAAKTILIMGGSQGAHGLNQAVLQTLPLWIDQRAAWQFIHLTGSQDVAECEASYRRHLLTAVVRAFSAEMDWMYSVADVVVARSGAASLTEISYYGLPSILVPYPAAADDHQMRNAEIFAQGGAAKVYREAALTPTQLNQAIREILTDAAVQTRMTQNAAQTGSLTAAERVAQEVLTCKRT